MSCIIVGYMDEKSHTMTDLYKFREGDSTVPPSYPIRKLHSDQSIKQPVDIQCENIVPLT